VLKYLSISNFALIDELEIELHPHLNVFTGETGAGKSIVIDAVNFLLGERAGPSVIRSGFPRARVQGLFEQGEEEILFSREIQDSGRNLCRKNGELLTLAELRDITRHLVDIHGQHEHQSLLDVRRHGELLDLTGGEKAAALLRSLERLHRELSEKKEEYGNLLRGENERARKIEWLQFEADEIEKARLRDGEEEELEKERAVLDNLEKITECLSQALDIVSGGDGGGTIDELGRVCALLQKAGRWDPDLALRAQSAGEAQVILEELSRNLSSYADRLDFSPERLETVNFRLSEIGRLRKKYGSTVADVLRYGEEARNKISYLAGADERSGALDGEMAVLADEQEEAADRLSEVRAALARRLEKAVEKELATLQMKGFNFSVSREKAAGISPRGRDTIEFMISPNPGEPLKPLGRIASGGEMSRLMLALKTFFGRLDGIPTLIFDEIDAGLGGRAAESVARKLADIGRCRQVICVTHLPIIASMADAHVHIRKEVVLGRTYTRVERIEADDRVEELARMLAGGEITRISREHAREMLKQASRKSLPPGAKVKRRVSGKHI
jgi:DNA repair protein RecN (Recombination protein N)